MATLSSTSGPEVNPAPSAAESPAPFISRRTCILILLALSSLMYLGTASSPALLDDADASHALVAREMLQRHDYVVMFLNGVRYLQKAPIHYWMVATFYTLLGQTEFATRLPVALAMIGLCLMVFEFGRRFFSARAGLYAGLVAGTSAGMFIFTRIMIPEAIYALEFTAIFYLFLRAWTGSLDPRVGYWGASVLTALAVLTRGLVGMLFSWGAIIGFIILTRGWKRWRELKPFSGAAIFLVIAAPWHILAELRAPGFFWSYFINEHFKRALGTRYPPDYDAVPLGLWWAAHLIWFFPWSIFLPFALRELPSPRTWWKGLSTPAQARLLLFCWAGTILGFFSVLGGSRMEYYSFGAWPAIALLLGLGLAHAEEQQHRWLPKIRAGLAGLGVLVAGVLGYAIWQSLRVRPTGDISDLLQSHPTDFYRLSMGHLFDLTPQAFADLRVPAAIAGVSMLVAFVAAWLLGRSRRALAASLAVALGMMGFFFAANLAFKVFEPHMSSRPLAVAINRYLRPEDAVVIYGEFDSGSSIGFYTQRRLWVYNGLYNNLELGSHYPDAPRIFLDDQTFPDFWRVPHRVFIFIPEEQREKAFARLPADSTWVLDELGGKLVCVNQRLDPSEPTLAEFERAEKTRR